VRRASPLTAEISDEAEVEEMLRRVISHPLTWLRFGRACELPETVPEELIQIAESYPSILIRLKVIGRVSKS
jgi:hypothetical protein